MLVEEALRIDSSHRPKKELLHRPAKILSLWLRKGLQRFSAFLRAGFGAGSLGALRWAPSKSQQFRIKKRRA
jgi:hypothetical protein